eukprot:4779969-Amphidinium_carterae.1
MSRLSRDAQDVQEMLEVVDWVASWCRCGFIEIEPDARHLEILAAQIGLTLNLSCLVRVVYGPQTRTAAFGYGGSNLCSGQQEALVLAYLVYGSIVDTTALLRQACPEVGDARVRADLPYQVACSPDFSYAGSH